MTRLQKLVIAYKTQCTDTLYEEILTELTPLLIQLTKTVPCRYKEDALQEGRIAILQALRAYVPHRGAQFITVAYKWMSSRIVRCIHKEHIHGKHYILSSITDALHPVHYDQHLIYEHLSIEEQILIHLIQAGLNKKELAALIRISRARLDGILKYLLPKDL